MKHSIILLFIFYAALCTTRAQNSVLVNFGSQGCYNSVAPAFSLLNNPFSGSPTTLAACNMSAQLPDFFSVFIAYNPKNNKVYVADVRSGTDTKIWVLDMGIPQGIACPATIPVAPTYSYSYISNNFEFDNNGDLWSFSNYNATTGQCNMDKFDVNTGTVINTRVLQFPAGNFPTSISSGDLTILPNGRMFATLGSSPSRLYEINSYSNTTGNASATYLQTMPSDCYGIAYLNGQLEITGIDFFGGFCYYFDYDISANTLGNRKPFQAGEAPIDNTSLTPSVGTTKQLVNAIKVNSNTADLTYEIYVRNLGNVILNDINATDDLSVAFGAANVSNVVASFVPGNNAAGLTLNPAYNGTTNINLLNGGQSLPNQTGTNDNYFFKVLVQCRVTNLNAAATYLNSAVGKGSIGNLSNASLIPVADSSNNGTDAVVDPNNNGNAGEVGENVPTPFNFGTLPVKFIQVNGVLINKNAAVVKWLVATPMVNAEKFVVEFSTNAIHWAALDTLEITNAAKGLYEFVHQGIPQGKLYYRIKEIDNDDSYTFSRIVLLQNNSQAAFVVFPNPANNYLQVSFPVSQAGKTMLELFDPTGRRLYAKPVTASTEEINTGALPEGTYLLKVSANGEGKTQKVVVIH
jgi:hypothetical protein